LKRIAATRSKKVTAMAIKADASAAIPIPGPRIRKTIQPTAAAKA
jgi:hypothetical protein